jgi:hypothetical protein
MALKRKLLVLSDVRSGINEVDPPTDVPERQMTDARNVEAVTAGICRKRQGHAEPAGLTYSMTAGKVAALYRHTPGAETATELWAITNSATPGIGRMVANSTTFASISPSDNFISSNAQHIEFASFNGKLFIAGDNAVDRLHCWDGTSLRRVGIKAASAAPTHSQSGGAVTDSRKYRVTFIQKSGSTIVARSTASAASTVATMSAQKSTVTRPTAPGDSETHWELWAAADDTNYTVYYYLSETILATTTADDNNVTLADVNGTILADDGNDDYPISVKHIVADEERLIMAGSWEQSAYDSRVFFTPVLGASNIGDDERVPNTTTWKNYIDVLPGVGGGITGLGGPLFDAIYVFKNMHTAKLVKTGVATKPFRQVVISKTVGAINAKSIVTCEDEAGAPAMYFLSRRGPYRISSRGLEYLGLDIENTWATVNLDAATVVAHGVYHHKKHQVWWWVATGSSDTPDTLLVYDTRFGVSSEQGVRGGWQIYDGTMAAALSSTMYASELGSATLTYDLKPYIGPSATNNKIYLCDKDGTYSDLGAGYQSYFKTKVIVPGGWDRMVKIGGVSGVFKPDATDSTCLWVRVLKDFGQDYAEYHLAVPSSDLVTRVTVDAKDPVAERHGPSQLTALQLYVYDIDLSTRPWQLDTLIVEISAEEQR